MLTTDRTTLPPHLDPEPSHRPPWVLPTAVGAAIAASAAAGVLAATVFLTPGGRSVEVTPVPAPSTAVPSAPAPTTSGPAGTGTGKQSGTPSGKQPGQKADTGTAAPALRPEKYHEIPAAEAVALLRSAGMTPAGDVREATRWTDRNGRNLLVVTRRIDARDSGGGMTAATIGVVHLAHLESRPVLLRRMTDPSGPPCEFDFSADQNGDFGVAGDLDGDGYVEVSVTWYSLCTSEAAPLRVKVALLSNGRKYILRGYGWAFGSRPESGQWPDNEITETEPAASSWPAGFHQAALNVFTRLYHE